jgi:2-polyprenyl-6-methoxyphenol hydroxylase-like FAD-dependent oxidoreductase
MPYSWRHAHCHQRSEIEQRARPPLRSGVTGPATAEDPFDVAIVGGGPVGLVLAILVAQRGRSVVVLERWPSPFPLPRAVHFDHEAGRILQACGLGDELRAIAEPGGVYEWRNAAGATLLRFGRVGDGASGWPESSMFCQPELEALLAGRAAGLAPVEVRRGVDVCGLAPQEGGVVLHDRAGGAVGARYVVGCDGANSTTRHLAGIGVEDLGFCHDWLIVDVVLTEPRRFDPLNVQVCDPARPTTVVSGGPGRRRWEFMRLPHETVDELNDEGRAWALLASWDVTPDNARLERHAVYTFQARYVEQWRAGRVLVAGDAAHQMPPFAGQGLCAGLRDAANLAWKLDLVLGGQAPDALLDTYGAERLPGAREAIRFSMELGKVICVADPAEAAARDEAMLAALAAGATPAPAAPGMSSGLIDPDSPYAGHLFVQGAVGGEPFDDVHGVGWRLVTLHGDEHRIDGGARAWFESIGGRVVAVSPADDTLRRWFSDHAVAWALQRPDFHLYGTADGPGAAGKLLARLRDHLAAPPTAWRRDDSPLSNA